jgi:peptidoglycan/LPS O-acetylase OafA/YrhL
MASSMHDVESRPIANQVGRHGRGRRPDSSVSGNASPRRTDVQGLRAVAVILVVLFHAGIHVPGGFTGVDIFFTISGFVITRTLVAELRENRRVDLPRFYERRVRRLVPALALMVTFVLAAAVLLSPPEYQRVTAGTGVSAMLFSSNIYLYHQEAGYFALSAIGNPLLHTWTLGVEEQFYLVFPLLLFVLWRILRSEHRYGRALTMTTVALVTVGSFALSLWLSYGHSVPVVQNPTSLAFYGSPTRAWEFGLGSLLALGELSLSRLPRRVAELLGAAGLAAIVVGAFEITSLTIFPGVAALLPTLGAAAVIIAGTSARGVVSRTLGVAPATWVGDRSYGWYLWHWALIVFAVGLWPGTGWAAPIAAAISLLVAAVSFRYVENPVRFSHRWRGKNLVAGGLVCVAIPAVAGVGLVAASHALDRLPAIHSANLAAALHEDTRLGCESLVPFGRPHAHPCLWPVPHSRGLVVLIGDSQAGQFTEAVVAAGNRAGYNVAVATNAGCPFVMLQIYNGYRTERDCLFFDEKSLLALVKRKPNLVITADRTDEYLAYQRLVRVRQAAQTKPATPSQKEQLWTTGLGIVLHRLNSANIPVLLVHPVPLSNEPPGGCSVLRILLSDACARSFSRVHVNAALRGAIAAENTALSKATESSAIDFENVLCDAKICHNVVNDVYMYRDYDHLSVDSASLLTGRFYRAIRLTARGSAALRGAGSK